MVIEMQSCWVGAAPFSQLNLQETHLKVQPSNASLIFLAA